jgi:hypothetical protein
MLKDNINFIEESVFPNIMKIFGWEIKDDYMTHDGLAVVRADFYPLGHIFAYSSKAIIVCDGEMQIVYDGLTFTNFEDMKKVYGERAIETFPEWEVKIEKQWAIKRSGEWVSAFTNLAEMPYRKNVRC